MAFDLHWIRKLVSYKTNTTSFRLPCPRPARISVLFDLLVSSLQRFQETLTGDDFNFLRARLAKKAIFSENGLVPWARFKLRCAATATRKRSAWEIGSWLISLFVIHLMYGMHTATQLVIEEGKYREFFYGNGDSKSHSQSHMIPPSLPLRACCSSWSKVVFYQ